MAEGGDTQTQMQTQQSQQQRRVSQSGRNGVAGLEGRHRRGKQWPDSDLAVCYLGCLGAWVAAGQRWPTPWPPPTPQLTSNNVVPAICPPQFVWPSCIPHSPTQPRRHATVVAHRYLPLQIAGAAQGRNWQPARRRGDYVGAAKGQTTTPRAAPSKATAAHCCSRPGTAPAVPAAPAPPVDS